ncbi:DUF5406 family protein [Lelliottia sp. SL45]|uniref:DUF5406 family protein n=1 Tax=Lelliottia sp. SL45 TaxID=2994665 RepID=UPI0022745C3E|nr:DUF5406 family protein [Lelliottia sp. SL45]MCY1697169.1 DUF5406 family protein [Lelliottia sp. SL45]
MKKQTEECTESKAIDFDPNFTLCGREAKQVVRLTFGQWQYRGSFNITVCGNITGLSIIKYAVENLYESLPYREDPFGEGGYASIQLGDLSVEDEDQREDEWLADMLIRAEIISFETAGRSGDE